MTYLMPIICRFCMHPDSEVLLNINEVNAEINVLRMLNNFNFNVNLDDSLPSLICRHCIDIIKKFDDFKRRCIEVEQRLRVIIYSSSAPMVSDRLACSSKLDTAVKFEQPESVQDYFNCDNQQRPQDDVTTAPDEITVKKKYQKKSGKHQCEVCGQVYKFERRLKNHMLIHLGLKPAKLIRKCEICHKEFARNENLKIHMRSHFGIRPFICDVCGKSSTKRQDLIRHMKIHSDDRNHVCSMCNSKFKRSGDLVQHMRTHTGDRPYSCGECQKNYTSHSGLRKHLLKTHSCHM